VVVVEKSKYNIWSKISPQLRQGPTTERILVGLLLAYTAAKDFLTRKIKLEATIGLCGSIDNQASYFTPQLKVAGKFVAEFGGSCSPL
jgi:hypothetical protein